MLPTSFADGVTLDFSATTFKEGLSTNVPLILKLTNSKVIGLHIDGKRLDKTGIYDYSAQLYGRDFLFKVDNNCSNVEFIDTILENAPYCAAMLGQNLKDIRFSGFRCKEIGEHIFYKTGYLSENNNILNLSFDNVHLTNVGINTGNIAGGHFVQFLKIANDGKADTDIVGYCDNVKMKNMQLKQDNVNNVAVTIFAVYDLRNALIDNVYGDFTSVFGGKRASNSKCLNSKLIRGFYTSADAIAYENLSFENCIFTGQFAHVNLSSMYRECTFERYFTSSATTALKNKMLLFESCTFKIDLNMSI